MVKAYCYSYRTVSTDSYYNFLIASNEDEAKEIALKNAHVEDLTAGGSVRL